MSEPAHGRTSIDGAIATLCELAGRADKLDLPVARIKLAHVACALADARMALVQTAEQLAARDHEIRELRRAFARHEATVEHHGLRYRQTPDGKPCGRPFCPRCAEVDARLILTHQLGGDCNEVFCPNCKTQYRQVQTFLESDERG